MRKHPSLSINPAMIAVVGCRAHVDILNSAIVEHSLRRLRDTDRVRDSAGAINDPVSPVIAAHQVAWTAKERRNPVVVAAAARARLGMKKDRPLLGVRLWFGKGTIRKDEVRFPGRDVGQAMSARDAALRHMRLG